MPDLPRVHRRHAVLIGLSFVLAAVTAPGAARANLTGGDCYAPHRPQAHGDVYLFQGTAGQPLSITLISTAFDTYLIAYGPDGRTVVEDDNAGGGTTARLQGVLPATTTYTIEVTSANASGVGAYTLFAGAPQ